MSQITLLTGERRRVWSEAEKAEILDEAFAPGANRSEVARRYAVSSGLIYTWRAKARKSPGVGFVEAVVAGDVQSGDGAATIQIELSSARVSIAGSASPALVEAVLRALR